MFLLIVFIMIPKEGEGSLDISMSQVNLVRLYCGKGHGISVCLRSICQAILYSLARLT